MQSRAYKRPIRQILIVALAATVAFAAMVAVRAPRAEAHEDNVQLINCLGWSVSLTIYETAGDNSVEIWVDGGQVTDVADFGEEYFETGTWGGASVHTLRVKVVAWDDPTSVNGWSFDRTLTSTACEVPQAVAAIQIEKHTNGEDADLPTGPSIKVGDPITWTFVVTNTGEVDLTDVTVTDDLLGDICTIGDLAAGASETCTKTGTAELGQYVNLGTVTGFYPESEQPVTDTDTSHYIGVEPIAPAIDVAKTVTPATLTVGEATTVTWTITVKNPGPVPLHGVYLTDAAVPSCDMSIGDLAVGETAPLQTCSSTHTASGPAWSFTNVVNATGFGPDGTSVTNTASATIAPITVGGTAQLGDTVWYDTNKNGIQDAGEQGINGAKVVLKDAAGTVLTTATTAKGPWDGWYKFVGLEAGTYTAAIDMSSVKSTYELTTSGSFTVALEEGAEYLDADFGLYEPEQLPNTGMNSGVLAILGVALLVGGAVAVRFSGRMRRDS